MPWLAVVLMSAMTPVGIETHGSAEKKISLLTLE
jgi:hypothetical protein